MGKRKFKPRKTTDKFKSEVYALVRNEYLVESEYVGTDFEIEFKHNIESCGRNFLLTPHQFKQGRRCPFCANRKTIIGFNDLHTRRPDIAKYLYDHDDGYKHYGSGEKIKWICPDCGESFYCSIADVCKRGLSCPRCSDGISYPNKLIYNVLIQCPQIQDLEREYRPEWCKYMLNGVETFGKYDICFKLKDSLWIIEMDGSLGHGRRTIDKTAEESLIIDKIKDNLAIQNGFNVIRINCDYNLNDRFKYIKNNILNSPLSELLNLNNIDWHLANIKSLASYVIMSVDLWNNNKSVGEIAEILHLSPSTITSYLKRCKDYELCNYDEKESHNRSNANKVYCLTTKEIFDSITQASLKYNISASSIGKCCRKLQCYAGEYNGEKLVWLYYHEYVKLTEDELKQYTPKENNNFTKIICLNNSMVFNSIIEGAEWSGARASGIQACCSGRYKYSGIDRITGENLRWMYYEDYLKLYNKDNLEESVA